MNERVNITPFSSAIQRLSNLSQICVYVFIFILSNNDQIQMESHKKKKRHSIIMHPVTTASEGYCQEFYIKS